MMKILIGMQDKVIIPNLEEEGQEKLLNTNCLIIGAGGLGCPVALYASAAGFGHIEIYDQDIIEISNLKGKLPIKMIRLVLIKLKI